MPKIIDERARREAIAEALWAIASREGLDAATVRAVAAECGLSTGAIQHSFPTQAALQQFAMELIVERVTERLTEAGTVDPHPATCGGNATANHDDLAPASDTDLRITSTAAPNHRNPAVASVPETRTALSEAVTTMLLQLLPLDEERETEARVWAAFSTAALTNPDLTPYARKMDTLLATFCLHCVESLASSKPEDGPVAKNVARNISPAASAPTSSISDPAALATHLHALLDGLTLHLLVNPSAAHRRQAAALIRAFVTALA